MRQDWLRVPTWFRSDWQAIAAVYAAAIAVRLSIINGALYGDEAMHFLISRNLGADPQNFQLIFETVPPRFDVLFWQRPLFPTLLFPATLVSFEAFRLLFVLYSSLLPVFAFVVLRDLHARSLFVSAAATLALLHPVLLVWGVRVFSDSLMTVLFALGLWSWIRGRVLLAGAAFTAATWTKETAVVGVGLLLAYEFLARLRSPATRLWPLRRLQPLLILAASIVLGLLPLRYALSLGLRFPGWTQGGEGWVLADRLVLSGWFLPLLVAGLRWPRTRLLSLLALGYPAFYLYYRFVMGREIQIWYHVQPVYLALVAAALILDEWVTRARDARPAWTRRLPHVTAVALSLIVLFQLAAPTGQWDKGPLTMPISHQAPSSLPETIHFEQTRDREMPAVIDHLGPGDWGVLFFIDVGLFYLFHPFEDRAQFVWSGFTAFANDDIRQWVDLIEVSSNRTILAKSSFPLNEAIRVAYADCITYENAYYLVVDGRACAGRGAQLEAEYFNRRAPPASETPP